MDAQLQIQPPIVTWEKQQEMALLWVFAAPRGEVYGAPDSWLQPGPALPRATMWRVNEWRQDSLSASISFHLVILTLNINKCSRKIILLARAMAVAVRTWEASTFPFTAPRLKTKHHCWVQHPSIAHTWRAWDHLKNLRVPITVLGYLDWLLGFLAQPQFLWTFDEWTSGWEILVYFSLFLSNIT